MLRPVCEAPLLFKHSHAINRMVWRALIAVVNAVAIVAVEAQT